MVVLLLAASTFGPFLYLTLFLLDVGGASPTAAGLQLLPLSVAALVVSMLGGRFARVLPVRVALPAGQLLSAAGLLAMRGVEASSPWTFLLPGLLLVGVGIGLSNPAVTYAALGVVPATRSGMASGTNNTFRQVGLAIGIAVLGRCSRPGPRATRPPSRPRSTGSCWSAPWSPSSGRSWP